MPDDNVTKLIQPGSFEDPLTEVLREGARTLLAQAVEAEVAEFLANHNGLKTEDGRARVVRHGHLPEREVMTGIGPVAVRQPRIRDRGADVESAKRIRFTPAILPPYARRSKSLEVLIPILYLKGISTGDFEEALAALLGKDAPGLSASTIARLKEAWIDEHNRWKKRDLSAPRYVYVWAAGKAGHASEFMTCPLSGRVLLPSEAERCEVTGQAVFPGLLEECAVSKQRVVPQELAPSSVSGRRALKQFLVASSISGVRCLQEEAIRSDARRFCTRMEAQPCAWSSRETHPDDLRICDLTGLAIHYSFATRQPRYRLAPLAEMLGGTRRAADEKPFWRDLAQLASVVSDGRCIIESAQASPNGKHLAVCAEQKKLLGLRTRYIGFVYSLGDRAIIGKLAVGKRANLAWVEAA